jgi:VanZ family protein
VLFYTKSDEFHQSFMPGRNASLVDVSIDLLGGVLGMVNACVPGIMFNDAVSCGKL